MITKNKNNTQTLEEIRLGDPIVKKIVIRTTDEKNHGDVSTIVKTIGGVMAQRTVNGVVLTFTTKEGVLALRKYNETHEDKVTYEVL